MTTVSIASVGLCAHYSPPGDWAFELALAIATRRGVRLNVFYFLDDPFDPEDRAGEDLTSEDRARMIVDRERELRLYFDARAGEYLDVGFRLCEDTEWRELHRCLIKREFQVLVLPYPHTKARFGGRPLIDFVEDFGCPVVVVGPDSPDRLYLNLPARQITDQLGLPNHVRAAAPVGKPHSAPRRRGVETRPI
jgi:hypothetical protein